MTYDSFLIAPNLLLKSKKTTVIAKSEGLWQSVTPASAGRRIPISRQTIIWQLPENRTMAPSGGNPRRMLFLLWEILAYPSDFLYTDYMRGRNHGRQPGKEAP